jgi:hypothetical protein
MLHLIDVCDKHLIGSILRLAVLLLQVLQHMQQKYPEFLPKQPPAGAAAAGGGPGERRTAQTTLLGQL